MGYVRHDAVIVTTEDFREGGLPDIEAFRQTLPEEWRHLVIGPVKSVVNGTLSYVFLPDGSNEGFPESDDGDLYRQQFRELFTTVYADGSSADDVVTVSFGADYGIEVGADVHVDWPEENRRVLAW